MKKQEATASGGWSGGASHPANSAELQQSIGASADESEHGCAAAGPRVSAFLPGRSSWHRSPAISLPPHPGLLGRIHRYELVDCVGEGGMGIVFRARDPESAQMVAVKLLKPGLATDRRAVAYFLKEGGHLQRLNHPNILPVLECTETPEGAWLVLPFMTGGSLASRLAAGPTLNAVAILRIAREVADALAFAHTRSIIHRDLKPSNILFDAAGRTFLGDFGLAQSLWNDELVDVRSHVPEGTVHYLSPGLARGDAEDTRGDIYALGAVLYEMLTGRPPYLGQHWDEVLKRIAQGPPPAIVLVNQRADRRLAAIAEGAMARELRDRYAHASYLLEDLQRAERGLAPLGPGGGLLRTLGHNAQAAHHLDGDDRDSRPAPSHVGRHRQPSADHPGDRHVGTASPTATLPRSDPRDHRARDSGLAGHEGSSGGARPTADPGLAGPEACGLCLSRRLRLQRTPAAGTRRTVGGRFLPRLRRRRPSGNGGEFPTRQRVQGVRLQS
ncbi:MAG: serine/threonine protein kinase [Verrucomicrobia bacterium]|nr:serine/threonine protein kinase [Verrucomicrobiota bacterium]